MSGLSILSLLKGMAQGRWERVRSSSWDRWSHYRQDLTQLDPPSHPASQHILMEITFHWDHSFTFLQTGLNPHSPAPTEPPLGMGAQLQAHGSPTSAQVHTQPLHPQPWKSQHGVGTQNTHEPVRGGRFLCATPLLPSTKALGGLWYTEASVPM